MTAALLDPDAQDEMGIAELASESVVILDEQAKVRYWNPAAERLFGWPALALRGREIGGLSSSPADEAHVWS